MIFVHTFKKVMDGSKTRTSRIIWDSGCVTRFGEIVSAGQYAVGDIVPVQPGRGKKGEGFIEITKIIREDVRNISSQDLRAEGFSGDADGLREFLLLWADMHDGGFTESERDSMLWYSLIKQRPIHFYEAWVYYYKLTNKTKKDKRDVGNLLGMTVEGNTVDISTEVQAETSKIIIGTLVGMLNDMKAPNFVQLSVTDQKKHKEYIVTIQKGERPTPLEIIQKFRTILENTESEEAKEVLKWAGYDVR